MFESPIDQVTIGSLFRLNRQPVFPALSPQDEFHHHSLPALDATGNPVIELGIAIESNKVLIDEPSVLVSKLNPRKPRVAVVAPNADERHCASTEFMCFVPRDRRDDLRYWAHYLGSTGFSVRLQRVAIGSTNSHTRASPSEVMRWVVPNPSHDEKRAIACVLDTLDTTIRQTEAIIEKLKQVKQGLLHDLLTRGIDANGELRPPQSEAPHLYKASPLGWIPVQWDVHTISDLLSSDEPAMRSGPFGSALLKHELVEQGLPLLGIDNVHTERFVNKFSRFVTEKKFNELSRYAVRHNDLMITIMGTVGRCCLVPDGIGPALSSKHTWTISLDQARYSPLLAMLQVNHAPWVLKQFTKDEQGGTMSAIRSETLRTLTLPTPPMEEQREMEARMTNISQRIDAEMQSVAKAKLLKSGLMDDLLTGRVRVTSLLQDHGQSSPEGTS